MSHPHKPVMRSGTADPTVGSTADPVLRRRRWLPTGGGRRKRVRAALVRVLSSPGALAATFIVAVLGLLIAFYVTLAQINLTNCLAEYNEAAAMSQAARAQAAAEDRALDLREREIDARTRNLDRIDDAAFDTALSAVGTDLQTEAFQALRRQRVATAEQRELNDLARGELAVQRQRNEVRRAANPVPAPPSQRCG